MMELAIAWVVVALLTESLVEVLKVIFPEKIQDKATFATSMVLGIVLAFAFSLNPFALTGFGAYVSTVSAGILASRGANYLNGILKQLGVIKTMK